MIEKVYVIGRAVKVNMRQLCLPEVVDFDGIWKKPQVGTNIEKEFANVRFFIEQQSACRQRKAIEIDSKAALLVKIDSHPPVTFPAIRDGTQHDFPIAPKFSLVVNSDLIPI